MRCFTAFAFVAFAVLAGTSAAATHLIDFDEAPDGSTIIAPDLFANTTRLSDLYAAAGVTFSGEGELNGGAIVNVGGGFGINPISGRNFLAFNSDIEAAMSDGGVPRGPETITFDFPVTDAAIFGGYRNSVAFRLDAYDALNQLVDSDTQVSSPGKYVRLAVAGQGIRTLRLDQDFTQTQAEAWVFDNLTYVPEPSSSALLFVGAVGLGAFCASKRSLRERRETD